MNEMNLPKEALGPVDKDGLHVPLNTRMLYDEKGERKTVSWFMYSPCLNCWMAELDEGPNTVKSAVPVGNLYLAHADSWETLLEDLRRTKNHAVDHHNAACPYFGFRSCASGCPAYGYSKGCFEFCLADIESRISWLIGHGDEAGD